MWLTSCFTAIVYVTVPTCSCTFRVTTQFFPILNIAKKASNVYGEAYHSTHDQGAEDDPNGEDKVSICSEGDEKDQSQQETQ